MLSELKQVMVNLLMPISFSWQDLLERQSDSVAERLDQLPWQQLLRWQVEDRISWWHMMQEEDCEPGTFQLSSLCRNIGMRADGWTTQKPEKKLNTIFHLPHLT